MPCPALPYTMLKYVVTRAGPTVVMEPDDIERVELLRSAGLVEAETPPTVTSKDGRAHYAGVAIIHGVTAAGRKLIGTEPYSLPIAIAQEPLPILLAGSPPGGEARAV